MGDKNIETNKLPLVNTDKIRYSAAEVIPKVPTEAEVQKLEVVSLNNQRVLEKDLLTEKKAA